MEDIKNAPLGVLEEICGRLASLTPEQFLLPELKREESMHFVCYATDEIKRLHTLRFILANEETVIQKEGWSTATEALRDARSKSAKEVLKELRTPGSSIFKMRARMKKLSNEMLMKIKTVEIVVDIFWAEVRRQPGLENSSRVCICSDWSLCWREEDAESLGLDLILETMLASMAGRRDIN